MINFVSPETPIATPTSGKNEDQVLVIAVSAAIIGFLLLLVMITLLGLICVVVWKRKSRPPPPEHSYRPQTSPSSRNMYESGAPIASKVSGDEVLKKQELKTGAPVKQEPPSDPEYATITEWRQMRSSSQEKMGVNNPFYASTDFLSVTKTRNVSTSATPSMEVLESSLTSFPAPAPEAGNRVRDLQNSCMAYSLQDMRSTGLKPGSKGTQASTGLAGNAVLAGNAGLTGNTGQPTRPLTSGYNSRSTFNIPVRTVQRHVSMKADISTTGPAVAPRPNIVRRNISMKALTVRGDAEDSHTPLSEPSGYLAPMNSNPAPLSGHTPPSGLHPGHTNPHTHHASGHTPLAPASGHTPLAPASGHTPLAPASGHTPLAPASGHHSPMRNSSHQVSSPLTHSIRAVKGGAEAAGTMGMSKEGEEDEDIGNDNYMIMSKMRQ